MIERFRQRVREIRAELSRLDGLPLPSSFCKAEMRKQILALAYRPDVTPLIARGDPIEFGKESIRGQVFMPEQRGISYTELISPLTFIAWLDPQVLIRRLDAEIDAKADDKIRCPWKRAPWPRPSCKLSCWKLIAWNRKPFG